MMNKNLSIVLSFLCICTCVVGVALGAINPVPLPTVICPGNLNSCTANDVVTTVKAVSILNVCYHNGVATSAVCTSNANCAVGDTCASRMGAGGDPGPVDPGASEPPPEGGQHAHMEPALEWALGYRCPMPPTVQLLEGPGGSSVPCQGRWSAGPLFSGA